MTLPTFVGIGVPRGGTTWLHTLLAAHPQIWVPTRRKEVGFFDVHYDRGLDWYAKFFPPDNQAPRYCAIGEVTAHYLYAERGPERMAALGTIEKLILILRHPVDRAYSHYWHQRRIEDCDESFEQALDRWPVLLHASTYSEHILRYLERFGRDQLLVLISEEATRNVTTTKHEVATFLNADPDLFPRDAGTQSVNTAKVLRLPRAFSMAWRLDHWLRSADMDWVVNLGKRLGAKRLLAKGDPRPPMRPDTRARLEAYFGEEVSRLEDLLQRDLDIWCNPPHARTF